MQKKKFGWGIQVCFLFAFQLLKRQIGVINFSPLKPLFLAIYNSCHAMLPTLPGLDSLDCTPVKKEDGEITNS